jgi:hypothetical protein
MSMFDRRADYDKFIVKNRKISRPDYIKVYTEPKRKIRFSRVMYILIMALIIGLATSIALSVIIKMIANWIS